MELNIQTNRDRLLQSEFITTKNYTRILRPNERRVRPYYDPAVFTDRRKSLCLYLLV